jgi:uncharacterized integral membrane protein
MKPSNQFAWAYFIFGLIIVVLILVFGIFILSTNYFSYVPKNFRIILGIFCIVYAISRLVNISIKFKKDDTGEKNN